MADSVSDISPSALHHAAHRADRLLAITLELNRMRDPDALLDFIIETAADVLDCEATSILLYDDATDQLHFAAATGADPGSLAEIPVPLNDSIAGTIFTTNEPLIIDDTAQDERHFEDVDDEDEDWDEDDEDDEDEDDDDDDDDWWDDDRWWWN